jgi:hypothetical protein
MNGRNTIYKWIIIGQKKHVGYRDAGDQEEDGEIRFKTELA